MPGGGPHDRNYKRKRGVTRPVSTTMSYAEVEELKQVGRAMGYPRGEVGTVVHYILQAYLARWRTAQQPGGSGG